MSLRSTLLLSGGIIGLLIFAITVGGYFVVVTERHAKENNHIVTRMNDTINGFVSAANFRGNVTLGILKIVLDHVDDNTGRNLNLTMHNRAILEDTNKAVHQLLNNSR